MSFIESRLPDTVAYAFQAVPAYDTRVVNKDNGRQKRNINRTRAKRVFRAIYSRFKPELFAQLLAAFHACAGAGYSFRFKDWTDYQAVNEPLGNTPGANTTPMQLKKTYTFPGGSQTRVRTITKPVDGTVVVEQSDGAGGWVVKDGTTDPATGLFTPSSNWTVGRAVRATFEFDVPVYFVSDSLPSTYEDFEAVTAAADLEEDFLS